MEFYGEFCSGLKLSEVKRTVIFRSEKIYPNVRLTFLMNQLNLIPGIWLDYDVGSYSHRSTFYPSNLYPLLVKRATPDLIERIVNYLNLNKVNSFPGESHCYTGYIMLVLKRPKMQKRAENGTL